MSLLLSNSVAGLFFQVVPVALLAALLYCAGRYYFLKTRSRPFVWHTELLRTMFVCYVTGLVNLVLVPPNFWGDIWYCLLVAGFDGWTAPRLFTGHFVLIPTFVRYLTGEFAGSPGAWVTTMLAGNFLMLIPMGIFVPLVFPRMRGRRMAAAALLIPLAMELLQPVVGRSFDTDDLICNSLGILLGWCLAALLRKKSNT
ncbi:MAG: hypothetical protein E7469_05525 [Ruminococcaceae bacterium]|nr:hypothetical protein [Oscillospiraceae bacterium]